MIKLTQNQIESWVAKHFDYKSRKGGDELTICNPFIPGDTKFKFNISTQLKETKQGHKGYWVHDWRPSSQNNNMSFIRFVQIYKNLPFKEAIKDICGEGIDLKSILKLSKPKIKDDNRKEQLEYQISLPENAAPFSKNSDSTVKQIALNYLNSRGINEKLATDYSLHYTSTSIVFPYFEYDTIVYWQSRSIIEKQFEFPRNLTGIGKSDFLYGFDEAEPYQPMFITEAIFCTLTLGYGSTAIGGAEISESQRRKIRMISPSRIILAMDNDEEGIAGMVKNNKLLESYAEIYYVFPPNNFKDWNDVLQKLKDKEEGRKDLRKYAESNSKRLTTKELVKLRLKRE